jgi:hypothetical protein
MPEEVFSGVSLMCVKIGHNIQIGGANISWTSQMKIGWQGQPAGCLGGEGGKGGDAKETGYPVLGLISLGNVRMKKGV